jgi:VIT1/CCC1 family predicted Fe2+/Mn2+ transporter
LPLVIAAGASSDHLYWWLPGTSLAFLIGLGIISARVGGSNALVAAWRVAFWGALAMGITAGAGVVFGAVA